MARACGSYPQCREFESPSRYVFSGSQMFIWLPDFYANRKSGTRLTLQKDGCRRNGLSTGFYGLLFILFLIAEQLSPRGTRKAPRCLGIGHSFVRLRELLKAPKRRFYICSLFAEIWPAAISTYNTAGRRESIFSTCSPLHDRFVIKVSTQYAVNLVGILVAYLGRSAIMLLLTDCCQLLHQLLHTGFFCLRQFLPKCHPQQASSMLTLQTNFPNLGIL